MKIKFERHFDIDISIILVGLSYLVFSVVSFLWFKGIFNFNQVDFLKVYSLVLVIQTISLINILRILNRNSKIFYSLFAFLVVLPFILFNFNNFHIVLPICFLILLLSFLAFSDNHRKSTIYLVIYTSISLISYLLLILWKSQALWLFLPSIILFVVFFFLFLKQIREEPRPFFQSYKKNENHLLDFLKHFIFIIIITNFVFIGTIGIHEMGHLFMASAFEGCIDNKIVYEINGFPHTEVTCVEHSDKNIWILAGFLLPVILSILLFFVGGNSIKEIGLEIFGFNLAISYMDFMDLGLSSALSSFFAFSGVVLCALSIALLARSRTQG